MDDFGTESNESGGALRQKLEEAIGKLKEREAEILTYKAKDLIGDKGLRYVKPEDLAGVSLKELEKKALEVEERKTQERADVLRSVLSDAGVPEDQLDARIATMLGDDKSEQRNALAALSSAGKLPGTPVPPLQVENMSAEDMIRAGVKTSKKK